MVNNVVPSNYTHADAELVERARICRYLLARAERTSSTLAAMALEQAAEEIDDGEHHRYHAEQLPGGLLDQRAPSGGWGDCWEELITLAGPDHPMRARMVERRAVGVARYGRPLRRDDGRDAARDLDEELLDAAVYAQRLGYSHLARELLTLASEPALHDQVLSEIATDLEWAEAQPMKVLDDVRIERRVQDGLEPLHDFAADLEAAARQSLEHSPSWGAILVEEVCEAHVAASVLP